MKEKPLAVLKNKFWLAFRIWWWVAWRSFLTTLLGGGILGSIIFIALKKTELPGKIIYAAIAGAVLLLSIIITVVFIKQVLNKRLKGFSIVVVKTK